MFFFQRRIIFPKKDIYPSKLANNQLGVIETNYSTSNSLTLTSNALAIVYSISKLGCISFRHQRETVLGLTFTFSANHLLVLSLSAKTPLKLAVSYG
jgi:hypothetical protein